MSDFLLAGRGAPGTPRPTRDYAYDHKVMMYRLGWYYVPRFLFDGPTSNWSERDWIRGIDVAQSWRAP